MTLNREAAAAVLAALLVPNICLWLAGAGPSAWFVLVASTLGNWQGFLEVLVYAIPLCLLGVGLTLPFRGGIFNIGADGQLIFGAIAAIALAPRLAGLGRLGLLIFLAAGVAGGGAVGALVGWLRARFRANEIIVTIMLNYVAVQALAWSIRGPLQERLRMLPRSDTIPSNLDLPSIVPGSRLHAGAWIAIAATIVAALLLRSRFGFKLAVYGDNPDAAKYAGYDTQWLTIGAMLFSGGCAGLAGAIEIAALHHRLEDAFVAGYGLAAIAVALMAGLSPSAVPLTAILFGVFLAGSGALQQQLGIPFPIAWIIEGSVILAFLAARKMGARA